MRFLVTSLVLSLVLTIVVNAVPRLFPRATENLGRRLSDELDRRATAADRHPGPGEPGEPAGRGGVRVWVPWRTMLIASVALTVVLNLVALLR